jgi:Holliday junction resolvase-like predicted endonuclease
MLGEIDVVAKDLQNVIIFVEVKSRRIFSQRLEKEIQPEEQITSQKMNKLQKIAENYISENNLWESDWQFDAISVIFSDNLSPKITHLENIFL